MAHEDKIKDTDAFFVVDAITRQIKNMTPQKIVLVQGDHNSEKFTFSLPRYIEGHDMAESASANLHYINASRNVKGMFVMTDLQIDPDNEENVICSWLISGNVTKEAGKLSFLIEFECYEGNVLVYSWHSLPYEGISIGESFDNAEEVAEMYADVLQQWYNEIAIGKNTEFGGVVMGNTEANKAYSPRAIAAGDRTISGARGFKIKMIQSMFENEAASQYEYILHLNSDTGLEKGMRISVRGNRTEIDCARISQEDYGDENRAAIYVVSNAKLELSDEVDDFINSIAVNYFTVVGRPDLGDIEVGFNSAVFGEECIAQEKNAFACGGGNRVLAPYGFACNRGNVAHHTSFASGYYTKATGGQAHSEGCETEASANASHAEGYKSKTLGYASHAEGQSVAKGSYSHTEGFGSVAEGEASHAENIGKAYGDYSHAENASTARGNYSHSEGQSTAQGESSHAEGNLNFAVGTASHAEGAENYANGSWSHAGGYRTHANGKFSFTHGYGLQASNRSQFVIGEFNAIDKAGDANSKGKYVFIIGKGTDTYDTTRKNAHTVDWDGNAFYAGNVECAGVILKSPNGTKYKLTVADDGTLATVKV